MKKQQRKSRQKKKEVQLLGPNDQSPNGPDFEALCHVKRRRAEQPTQKVVRMKIIEKGLKGGRERPACFDIREIAATVAREPHARHDLHSGRAGEGPACWAGLSAVL